MVLAVGALAISGCAGKGAEGSCGIAGDCGGDPNTISGTYTLMGACQYAATNLYQPMNLTEQVQQPQNPSVAPLQPQPTTTGDWCSMLVYNAMGVQSVNLFHDSPGIFGGGTVAFGADKRYQVSILFQTPTEMTHFPETCLRYNGQNPSCSQLQDGINSFYQKAAMQNTPANPLAFQNLKCDTASDGDGCDCSYTYQVILTDEGAWQADNSLIVQSSSTYRYNGVQVASQAPTRQMVSTYCQQDKALTMTGLEGTTIEDVVGLRSVALQKN